MAAYDGEPLAAASLSSAGKWSMWRRVGHYSLSTSARTDTSPDFRKLKERMKTLRVSVSGAIDVVMRYRLAFMAFDQALGEVRCLLDSTLEASHAFDQPFLA